METPPDVEIPVEWGSERPDPTPRWDDTIPYQELRNGQIRLLHVEPTSPEVEIPVRCTLSTHDLVTAPSFTALSYTWGLPHGDIDRLRKSPASKTRYIICNGRKGQVGENLHDFLVHCVHSSSQDLLGYWWIDALSINQADIEERSEQVKLMSDIYQTATGVFVWLGPEDHFTELAIYLMKDLLRLDKTQRLSLHSAEVRANHPNGLLDLSNWQALSQFFQREWFNRTWIIQEVVLAKSVAFFCGQHSISWTDLSALSHFFATSSWTILLTQAAYQTRGVVTSGHNTAARLDAAQRTWRSDHHDKFLYALIRARSSNSENPRDKVYSQLGLGNVDIYPDYHASVADVYITAARYILEHSKSLLLLTCVEGEDFQTVPGLPSWVPDWSVTQTLGLRSTGYSTFSAALHRPKRQELSVDHNGQHLLSIEATELDEIVEAFETKPELRDNIHATEFWETLSKLDANYAAAPAPGQSREEAIWRTLMTNREDIGSMTRSGGLVYPASLEPLGSSFRDWILWRYAVATEAPSKYPNPLSTHDKFLPSQAEILDAREKSLADPLYLADLEWRASLYDVHYCHGMRLRPFCTKQGYFGIGTQSLRNGDGVWIVPGCPVPLILRRTKGSERYRLVGGSYVHGFMNGEVFQREGVQFDMVSLE